MFKNLSKLVLNNRTMSTIAISNKQSTRLFCTRYTRDHEWARSEGGNNYTMGITDFAQRQLGDIVFVDTPIVGTTYIGGKEIGIIESVKAAAEVFAPFEMKVIQVNQELEAEPELINTDPLTEGWICKFESSKSDEFKQLMNEAEYKKYTEAEH